MLSASYMPSHLKITDIIILSLCIFLCTQILPLSLSCTQILPYHSLPKLGFHHNVVDHYHHAGKPDFTPTTSTTTSSSTTPSSTGDADFTPKHIFQTTNANGHLHHSFHPPFLCVYDYLSFSLDLAMARDNWQRRDSMPESVLNATNPPASQSLFVPFYFNHFPTILFIFLYSNCVLLLLKK